MWWYMRAPLPSSEFWLVSYSLSVTSSITGPVEKIFGLIEVAPSSIDRAGQHGRKNSHHSTVSKQVSASLSISVAWLYS